MHYYSYYIPYYFRISLLSFLILLSTALSAAPPRTFTQAKNIAQQLFSEHRETLYCRCKYTIDKKIQLASCAMEGAAHKKRALRVEWEHIFPASHFGQHFKCWREPLCKASSGKSYKGRHCCRKIDRFFKQAENELYNLWPVNGLVNQVRSNYPYGSVTDGITRFYGCPVRIDSQHKKFEPPPYTRGVVARASLFMSDHYKIRLSPSQHTLFHAWNLAYPPTDWEKTWAKKVEAIEGYPNPYIQP